MEKPPETAFVTVKIDASVCHLSLSREDKLNALNQQLITELIELLAWSKANSVAVQERLRDDDGEELFRILVLSGAGKHFCAGADINMMREAGARSAEENRKDSRTLDALFNGLWSHPCFTIGTVQGAALGGGAGLVACLDHVIVSEDLRIAMSEGKLGILPAVIGPYVYRRVGSACFRRLAMQASRIGAKEALRIGLVEQVVADSSEFPAKLKELTTELLSSAPRAVAAAKQLTLEFDRWQGDDVSLREMTLEITSIMRGSVEGQEGLSSFLDSRRAPNWHPDAE